MRWLRRFVFGALVLVLGWSAWSFRSGNDGVIDLDLVWVRVHGVPVWSALGMALVVGASLGGLVVGFAWLRQRILNRRHRKAIERLESEVERLRSIPLAGGGSPSLEPTAAGASIFARFGARRREESS
ncbi:MAG: LapA family protein [Deltaproteobacteria bacterium]|nr:LapA family protein [Deltaproteobacteria bacterium]